VYFVYSTLGIPTLYKHPYYFLTLHCSITRVISLSIFNGDSRFYATNDILLSYPNTSSLVTAIFSRFGLQWDWYHVITFEEHIINDYPVGTIGVVPYWNTRNAGLHQVDRSLKKFKFGEIEKIELKHDAIERNPTFEWLQQKDLISNLCFSSSKFEIWPNFSIHPEKLIINKYLIYLIYFLYYFYNRSWSCWRIRCNSYISRTINHS